MPQVRKVQLQEPAIDDIKAIYRYLAELVGHERAETYTARIESFCRSLGTFSERGRLRPELGEGLRTIVFESRAVIAYRLTTETVLIVRVIHGAQDYDSDFFN